MPRARPLPPPRGCAMGAAWPIMSRSPVAAQPGRIRRYQASPAMASSRLRSAPNRTVRAMKPFTHRSLAERLGVPIPSRCASFRGTPTRLDQGNGTGGSRSMAWGGCGGASRPADEMIERGIASSPTHRPWRRRSTMPRRACSAAAPATVTLSLDRACGEASRRARWPHRVLCPCQAPAPTFPNGCHIAEVEIDPDDRHQVKVVRYNLVR